MKIIFGLTVSVLILSGCNSSKRADSYGHTDKIGDRVYCYDEQNQSYSLGAEIKVKDKVLLCKEDGWKRVASPKN